MRLIELKVCEDVYHIRRRQFCLKVLQFVNKHGRHDTSCSKNSNIQLSEATYLMKLKLHGHVAISDDTKSCAFLLDPKSNMSAMVAILENLSG